MAKVTPRQQKRGRKKESALVAEGLKVAVLTSPPSEPESYGRSLEHDIELVRAAVLYADEVELVSIGAVMLASLTQFGRGDDDSNFWTFLASLDDATLRALGGGGFPEGWREAVPVVASPLASPILQLIGMNGASQALDKLQHQVRQTTTKLRNIGDDMIRRSGAAGLEVGLDSGIVKISPVTTREVNSLEDLLVGWLELLVGLLRDPRKRLLFDDVVGSVARGLVDKGHVQPHALTLKHAGEAAVGSGFVARLPAFPQAPLDELLDLRADLAAPLTRYRAAVSHIAARLTVRAFDREVAAEIEDLWLSDVAPALSEIEEGFAEHGLVREVARTLGQDLKTLLVEGAALYVGLDNLTTLNGWVSATTALAGPAVQAAATGAKDTYMARRDLKKKDLFYLYEVNRRLT
jgi:hypothetical protein